MTQATAWTACMLNKCTTHGGGSEGRSGRAHPAMGRGTVGWETWGSLRARADGKGGERETPPHLLYLLVGRHEWDCLRACGGGLWG